MVAVVNLSLGSQGESVLDWLRCNAPSGDTVIHVVTRAAPNCVPWRASDGAVVWFKPHLTLAYMYLSSAEEMLNGTRRLFADHAWGGLDYPTYQRVLHALRSR